MERAVGQVELAVCDACGELWCEVCDTHWVLCGCPGDHDGDVLDCPADREGASCDDSGLAPGALNQTDNRGQGSLS